MLRSFGARGAQKIRAAVVQASELQAAMVASLIPQVEMRAPSQFTPHNIDMGLLHSANQVKLPSSRFMRENTADSFDAPTNQRNVFNIPTSVELAAPPTLLKDGSYAVEFTDGHTSTWKPPQATKRLEKLPRKEWTNPQQLKQMLPETDGIPKFQWEEVQANPKEFFHSLHTYGFLVMDGVPNDSQSVVKHTENVAGYVQSTIYGKLVDIKVSSNLGSHNNIAFTSDAMPMHMDMPFQMNPPGIQQLHCLSPATIGGDNFIVDGFALSKKLSAEHYQALCEHEVHFTDVPRDEYWNMRATHPIFHKTRSGLQRINYSERYRDSAGQWMEDAEQPSQVWYAAMEEFERLIEDPANQLVLKLEAGQMLVIDNWRMLHTRNAFAGGCRHMAGSYMEWDAARAIYARLA